MKEYEEMTQKQFARKYKVSQRSLAKILGMSQQALFQFEQSVKHDHVVRYNKETGDVSYVRTEKVIATGKNPEVKK